MWFPVHQFGSVALAAGPATVAQRLLADPDGLVRTATADALTAMGPQLQRWGRRVAALPVTTARATGSDQLGCVELAWSGAEDATGWPALTGQLVVAPAGPAGARLRFFSRRSPHAELATSRLDRLHRHRIVQVSVQRFLRDLGRQVDDTGARPSPGHLERFDRTPMFVHHLQPLDVASDVAQARLVVDLPDLAQRATTTAVSGVHGPLRAGRFRAPARPAVLTRLGQTGDPACVWVGWRGDEEATGWPQLELALLIEARRHGSTLALLSAREPGYDLSRPRSDKHHRDRILRSVGPAFAEALRERLAVGSPGAASSPRPQLASARR
jgi:hypothetical protein